MVPTGVSSLMAENLSDVWKRGRLSAAALIELQLCTTLPSIDLIVAGRPPFVCACLMAVRRRLTGFDAVPPLVTWSRSTEDVSIMNSALPPLASSNSRSAQRSVTYQVALTDSMRSATCLSGRRHGCAQSHPDKRRAKQ